MKSLTFLDWTIFVICLLITLALIIWGESRKKTSTEKENFLDHMLMGRALTLPFFTATLVATWYGGIFGVTEIAFKKGLFNFLTQGVFWYITYIIFALFMVERVRKYKCVTLPELVGVLFGKRSQKLAGLFNFFNVLPIVYTISLGLLLQSFFGGSLGLMMVLGITVVVLYSFYGGLRAVVFSDLAQFFIMCAGVLLVIIFSVSSLGGLDYLQTRLPDRYFSLTGGEGLLTTFVWGLIALSTLVDPNFYQRCFAAKSTKVAKRGIFLSTMVWLCFDLCTTFGAMYARAYYGDIDASGAYLNFAVEILPSGLRGFFLAGILATILSTLDSYLFLAGTTLSYDIGPKKWQGNLLLTRLGVIFTGILAVVMATVFDGNIKVVWKTLGSYSAACLLLPVLFGQLYPRRLSDNQFIGICLSSVVTTSYWRLATHEGFWANVDEIYIGSLTTAAGIILCLFIQAKSSDTYSRP